MDIQSLDWQNEQVMTFTIVHKKLDATSGMPTITNTSMVQFLHLSLTLPDSNGKFFDALLLSADRYPRFF